MSASNGPKSYPTVLVAEENTERRNALMHALCHGGYLVLEAHDEPSALLVITTHSRPIHLLLINGSMDHRPLADRLKEYRREMEVLFVGQDQHEALSDVLSPDFALANVRAFFGTREMKQMTGKRESGTSAVPTGTSVAPVPPVRSFKAAG